MKDLDRMLLLSFVKIFCISLLFFIFILELVDLFANLWRYINNDANLISILKILYYYLPKCIIYSIPPALLFSVSFTLGSFYADNELIAVFGSGISLYRFTFPLIITGLLLSVFSFYFNDTVVIDYSKQKLKLTNYLLGRTESFNNTNVTIIGKSHCIYDARYYNDSSGTLSGLTVIIMDKENNFKSRIDSDWAVFKNGLWEMHKTRIFTFNKKNNSITESYRDLYLDKRISEKPDTFKRKIKNISELRAGEAKKRLTSIKKAGLSSYRKLLTGYYVRFSLTLTPLIVVLFSSAIGGRFKKNVLLMSLLASLSISVIYYVIQMILVLFAKQGYIPPITGAWGTFIIFFLIGILLFRNART